MPKSRLSATALRFRNPTEAARRRPVAEIGCSGADAGAGEDNNNDNNDDGVTSAANVCASRANLLSLPSELHFLISGYLTYPDALSLKHSTRHFYGLVDTGLRLKVEWLIERRRLHLECPNETRCDLGTDIKFCRGSVPMLMRRRREHIECESRPGLGCIIYDTPTCPHRRKGIKALKRWLKTSFTVELWWVLLALLSALLGWFYLAMFS